MVTKIYAVFDSKVAAYLQPMFFRSNGEAIRAFAAAVSDAEHQFSKFASDYTLFELGAFNDENAQFDILAAPVPLGCAIEFKAKSE